MHGPDFLVYAEYFIRKDYGDEWFNDQKKVKEIRQFFQTWIYGVNDKGRGNQSLTFDQSIIINNKPIQIGEFVEQFLLDNEFEKDISNLNYTTLTLNRETGKHELKKVKGVIKHKTNNKLVQYTLRNKQQVTSTDNHSFFTRKGLDIIEIQRNHNPTNLLVPFNFIDKNKLTNEELEVFDFNGKKGTENIKLNEDWMYLLGQYIGDGHITGSTLSITTFNKDQSTIIGNMFPEFTYFYSKDGSLQLNFGKNICNSIIKEFNKGSYNKCIDRKWATHKNILHLIGGYIDSDGCSAQGQKGFVIVSVNKELLNSVQYILMGYGILSSLKTEKRMGFGKQFIVHTLRISAKGSRILNNYTKFKKFNHKPNNRQPERIFVDLDNIMTEIYNLTNLTKKQFKDILCETSYKKNCLTVTEIDLVCERLIDLGFKEISEKLIKFKYSLPIRVVDIKDIEHQEFVYDISVEDNENFLTANNIYAHNSPFTNISVFDKYWREALFSKHTNPDFSPCNLENLKRVQRLFVDVLLEQQKDNPFTFPVMTACQLKDPETGQILDKDWLDWLSTITVENKLMNIYTSSSIDSLSSCLFKGNKITVIHKITGVKEIIDIADFVHRFINPEQIDKELDIQNYQIQGYNIFTGKSELIDIKGVIKKSNNGLKVTISTGDEQIYVSPDHLIAIRDINSGEIKEIKAADLVNIDYSNFEISVE